MYRDDPLDDEMELREIAGDQAVDRLIEAGQQTAGEPLLAALDALRVLQGWVDDRQAGRWLASPQQRLGGQTPIDALCAGETDEVLAASRNWAAAQG